MSPAIGDKIKYKFSSVSRPSFGEVIDTNETTVTILYKRTMSKITYTLPLSPEQFEVLK